MTKAKEKYQYAHVQRGFYEHFLQSHMAAADEMLPSDWNPEFTRWRQVHKFEHETSPDLCDHVHTYQSPYIAPGADV